ncbi:MAG: phosphotransferase [Gammaproteobacteria bacterium]|nr:phosphotransferase [Gammaproteobacteria bacterium]
MSNLPIPTHGSHITSDWLNAVLHRHGESASQINNVDVETIGTGVGLVGGLYRCHLRYESVDESGPTSVVIKIRSNDPKSLKVAKTFLLYQKEVAFYRDIASLTPISVPKLHYCDFDPKSHDFVLVLEDLEHLDVPNQLNGGTEEQGRIAIRHAARLHARFWNKVKEPPLNGYFSLVAPSFTVKIHVGFHNSVAKVLDVFDRDLSPVAKDLIRAFGDDLAGHYHEMARGPRTLTHGDYRLDNMFFGQSSGPELVVIDWQTNGIGVGMADVAYFMAGSLDPSIRQSIERDAIAEYHEITSVNGGANWNFDECWRAYRQAFVAAMTVPVIAAGELSLDNERAFELVQTGIRRMNAAVEQLNVDEFMPRRRSIFTVPGFQSAIANQVSRLVRTGNG